MKYLADLNPSQREAALWDDGPLLVLAGPGSGKTKTLISRVARLVDESKNDTFRILCLTFTRKAAVEMRDRLFAIIPEAQNKVNLSTFHSFATDILRQHGSHFHLTPDFSIIDKEEQISIIKKIISNNDKDYSAFLSAEKVLDAIEYLFKELVPDEKVSSLIRDPSVGLQLTNIFKAYKASLCEQNALDYGAIIYLCEQILRERPRLARQLRNVYKYICVDEFQDTNSSQYALLRSLSPEKKSNLFIVGDDDQIIYQWNGASPRRIEVLKEDYDLKQIQLPENYRCPAEVVELANNLISHNNARLADKKPLRAMHDPKDITPVRVHKFCDDTDEAMGVAKKIQEKLNTGSKPTDIVVLARNTKLLKRVAAALCELDVECFVPQRKTNFESAPLRLMIETLKLSIVRSDQEILAKLTKAFFDCFGIEVMPNKLAVMAAETNGDYLQAFSNSLATIENDQAKLFLGLLSPMLKNEHWLFIAGAFDFFSTLSKEVSESDEGKGSEEFAEYYEEVKVWDNIVMELGGTDEAKELSLGQLLQEIALANKTPEPPSSAVRCFTIHASKGMEFSHVFLVGLSEDQLPSFHAIKKESDSHEMQEERRNCFVAITRTKQTLTMTYANKYNGWNKKPSRFLSEMGLLP